MTFPDDMPETPASAPAAEFRGVSFAYDGAGEAVSDLNLTVPKGQTVGMIGGTGSGKTTVVNLLARFYDAASGAVLLDGVDVRDYPKKELIRRIGVVPQKAVLMRGSIRDNLKMGDPDASDEALWRALELAQARDFVAAKDGGLDYMLEEGGNNLSGGQRQRLTIARALVKQPEILILDDPSSALDTATDRRLRQAIRSLKGSMTVWIVSQRVSSVRDADVIFVMDDGALVGAGRHEDLMETCRVYRDICASQFPELSRRGGETV